MKDSARKAMWSKQNQGISSKYLKPDYSEPCSICHNKQHTMPKAGSGTVVHWVCKNCVDKRNLEVLPEYLENIKKYNHWYRS